ncbi:GAF domain-containing protein [Nocardia sp. CA-107356]|uniref:GAF domain-containing protein n=1 Tax=Nocardia sp. CA-107356 TaxID=3239972 RepID=UPI003D8D6918
MNASRPQAQHTAISDRTDRDESGDGPGTANPWVLVATLADRRTWWVVAEGAQPRRWTRLSRTRIASSSSMNQHLVPMIGQAISSGEPQIRSCNLSSGVRMQIIAVPVVGPNNEVFAVHVWGGPRFQPVPPRPSVGTLMCRSQKGFTTADSTFEDLIDADAIKTPARALPELMRHFEGTDDTAGLMRLFDETPEGPTLWCATVVTTGVATNTRRNLFIAAASVPNGHGRTIRAIAYAISNEHDAPSPTLCAKLVSTLPIQSRHAVGITDLTTGLVHQWIKTGPPPLDRWMCEIPETHPDDVAEVAHTRARLLAGVEQADIRFRLRFDTSSWVSVHAHLAVLTRGISPQACLDVRLATRAAKGTDSRRPTDLNSHSRPISEVAPRPSRRARSRSLQTGGPRSIE